jgi:transposase
VSWPTVHRALVAAAARWLPAPAPTRVLGIDETRSRSVRWILAEAGWKRSDPWLTSFVDADPTRRGPLLGLAPGRTGGCVRAWLGEQTPAFRAAVELVVIDPSAPYASGIRRPCPGRGSRSTGSIWPRWPTRWSPKSVNASPATCSVAAARSPTRCG